MKIIQYGFGEMDQTVSVMLTCCGCMKIIRYGRTGKAVRGAHRENILCFRWVLRVASRVLESVDMKPAERTRESSPASPPGRPRGRKREEREIAR